jgi:hypothetical protein
MLTTTTTGQTDRPTMAHNRSLSNPYFPSSSALLSQPTTATTTPTANTNALLRQPLLMPTVRLAFLPPTPQSQIPDASPPQQPLAAHRSPRLKPTTAKLIRSRSGSASASDPVFADANVPPLPVPSLGDVGLEWIGIPCKFEVVQEQLEIEGYQMYAVEKWCVGFVFRLRCIA